MIQECNKDLVWILPDEVQNTSESGKIILPDMVRESGEIMYTRNLAKFDRTPISTEKIKLIIKF